MSFYHMREKKSMPITTKDRHSQLHFLKLLLYGALSESLAVVVKL